MAKTLTYGALMELDLPKMLFTVFGMRPEYGPAQLEDIEKFIKEHYPEGYELLPTTVLTFGYALCRALLQIPGVEWGKPSDTEIEDITDVELTMTNGEGMLFVIRPMTRILKFMNDRSDSLVAYWYMTQHLSVYDITSQEYRDKFCDEEGWIHLDNGVQFRFLFAEKDGEL